MLGPMTISRDRVALKLPTSRKVRALIAYLALAPRALTRAHLCELLGDIPNDPRGELRWCLSKARAVLDEPGRQRIETSGDTVALDLTDCFVDVVEITQAMQTALGKLDPERLRALSTRFVGDFLEGLEVDRSPALNSWLVAQRRRFRACHVAVLEHLVASLTAESEDILGYLEKRLQLARPARARDASEHARTAPATSRGRGTSGCDRARVRGRGSGLEADSRQLARCEKSICKRPGVRGCGCRFCKPDADARS